MSISVPISPGLPCSRQFWLCLRNHGSPRSNGGTRQRCPTCLRQREARSWVGNIITTKLNRRPSPVHPFSEPLEDADEIVTSVNSLFLSREDSRGVDHCHTLQHWALDNRALEPGQSFIKGREGMKKATCWGRLHQTWWEDGIVETCRLPKHFRESPKKVLFGKFNPTNCTWSWLKSKIRKRKAYLFVFFVG